MLMMPPPSQQAFRSTLWMAKTIETLGWTCWNERSHFLHPPEVRAAVVTVLHIAERFSQLDALHGDAECGDDATVGNSKAESAAGGGSVGSTKSQRQHQVRRGLGATVVPVLPNEVWVTIILRHCSVFDWLGPEWKDPRIQSPAVPNILAGDAPPPQKAY